MKKTTQIILLFIAIVIGSLSTTQAAFPLKQTQTATENITSTAAPIVTNEVIAETANTGAKSLTAAARGGGGKSKIVAAILAFFLGFLGVHSFYMGNTKKGLLQLALTIVGIVLYFVGLASAISSTTGTFTLPILAIIGVIMLLVSRLWAFIDFVRILTGGLEPESGFDD